MSRSNKFLPAHPKIVKIVNSRKNSPRLTSRSSWTNSYDDSQLSHTEHNIDGSETENIVAHIIYNQTNLLASLSKQIEQLSHKNLMMGQSLKYYDNHKQQKNIRQQISSTQQQINTINQKIKNCQKIQKSTTSEQYYLWQKKKKTDEFQARIQQAQEDYRQQNERLKNLCIEYGKAIDQVKQDTKQIAEQIVRLQIGVQQEVDTDQQQINEDYLSQLKQQYKQLKSTVGLIKQGNAIMKTQFKDSADDIHSSIHKAYDSYKSSLIKDLYAIKSQVQDAPAELPLAADKESRTTLVIQDYENKIKQLKQSVNKQQIQYKPQLFQAYNWQTVKIQNYLGQYIMQGENSYEKYQQYTSQLQQLQGQITSYSYQLTSLINEAVEFEQKKMQLQQTFSRAYRNSSANR